MAIIVALQERDFAVTQEVVDWGLAPEAKALKMFAKGDKLVGLAKKVHKGNKAAKGVSGVGSRVVGKSIAFSIKEAGLSSSGKIRFIPRPSDVQSGKVLKKQGVYVDKFGNV